MSTYARSNLKLLIAPVVVLVFIWTVAPAFGFIATLSFLLGMGCCAFIAIPPDRRAAQAAGYHEGYNDGIQDVQAINRVERSQNG